MKCCSDVAVPYPCLHSPSIIAARTIMQILVLCYIRPCADSCLGCSDHLVLRFNFQDPLAVYKSLLLCVTVLPALEHSLFGSQWIYMAPTFPKLASVKHAIGSSLLKEPSPNTSTSTAVQLMRTPNDSGSMESQT